MLVPQYSWLVWTVLLVYFASSQAHGNEEILGDIDVMLVKIGGSSITNKGEKESINAESLDWFLYAYCQSNEGLRLLSLKKEYRLARKSRDWEAVERVPGCSKSRIRD